MSWHQNGSNGVATIGLKHVKRFRTNEAFNWQHYGGANAQCRHTTNQNNSQSLHSLSSHSQASTYVHFVQEPLSDAIPRHPVGRTTNGRRHTTPNRWAPYITGDDVLVDNHVGRCWRIVLRSHVKHKRSKKWIVPERSIGGRRRQTSLHMTFDLAFMRSAIFFYRRTIRIVHYS